MTDANDQVSSKAKTNDLFQIKKDLVVTSPPLPCPTYGWIGYKDVQEEGDTVGYSSYQSSIDKDLCPHLQA